MDVEPTKLQTKAEQRSALNKMHRLSSDAFFIKALLITVLLIVIVAFFFHHTYTLFIQLFLLILSVPVHRRLNHYRKRIEVLRHVLIIYQLIHGEQIKEKDQQVLEGMKKLFKDS